MLVLLADLQRLRNASSLPFLGKKQPFLCNSRSLHLHGVKEPYLFPASWCMAWTGGLSCKHEYEQDGRQSGLGVSDPQALSSLSSMDTFNVTITVSSAPVRLNGMMPWPSGLVERLRLWILTSCVTGQINLFTQYLLSSYSTPRLQVPAIVYLLQSKEVLLMP